LCSGARPSLPSMPSLPPLEPAGPELPAVDADAPEHKKVERWNQVLNASPVFAGQGDFEVKTPSAPAAGALELAVNARFEFASAPTDAEPVVHMLVSVAPYGAALMADHPGPVAHIVLALDLSKSMDTPEKYPVLGRALAGMFRELRSKWAHEVLVSVVAFAYGAETLVRAVPSSQLDEREVLRLLDSWDKRFTRYTDVVGALHRCGRIARDSVRTHRAMPVRIYLLTDGRPQDMPGARAVMAKIAKMPVDVHGLAFGEDADVDALTDLISGSRGGTVKHIRIDTIGEAFGRIGEVAQLVVANRALLDVELRPGVIGGDAYRYRPGRHRFPKGSFDKGAHFTTDLGTLESGRTYSLVFQLRLRRTKRTETEVGRITLRIPGYGGPRVFEKIVSLPRHPGAETGERDPEVQAALDVVSAIAGNDAAATLKALRTRRGLYAQERRDTHVLFVIDKAIQELERHGNLLGLTASEHATLVSHTLTTRVRREAVPAGATSAAAVSADIARALATLDDGDGLVRATGGQSPPDGFVRATGGQSPPDRA
jgi:uncharacterized protein YegL